MSDRSRLSCGQLRVHFSVPSQCFLCSLCPFLARFACAHRRRDIIQIGVHANTSIHAESIKGLRQVFQLRASLCAMRNSGTVTSVLQGSGPEQGPDGSWTPAGTSESHFRGASLIIALPGQTTVVEWNCYTDNNVLHGTLCGFSHFVLGTVSRGNREKLLLGHCLASCFFQFFLTISQKTHQTPETTIPSPSKHHVTGSADRLTDLKESKNCRVYTNQNKDHRSWQTESIKKALNWRRGVSARSQTC